MKNEHPILYSTEMVRAYLEDRKTKTRRVIKPQPEYFGLRGYSFGQYHAFAWKGATINDFTNTLDKRCPYGQTGDILWCREAFSITQGNGQPDDFYITYRAGGEDAVVGWRDNGGLMNYLIKEGWRPSIFLPRRASRLTQTITSIRVERLQEISDADIIAEGYPYYCEDDIKKYSAQTLNDFKAERRTWYRDLWDSINAKRGFSWYFNPWVWVISYPKYSEEPTRKEAK